MKILKRLSALMLAMLLLLSFAACGGKDGGEDSDVTDAPETNYEREVKTKIAALNGPTGLGLAEIKADRSYAYDVEYYSQIAGRDFDSRMHTAQPMPSAFHLFVDAVRDDKPFLVRPEEGVTVMKILDAIYKSAATGEPVRV